MPRLLVSYSWGNWFRNFLHTKQQSELKLNGIKSFKWFKKSSEYQVFAEYSWQEFCSFKSNKYLKTK